MVSYIMLNGAKIGFITAKIYIIMIKGLLIFNEIQQKIEKTVFQ